MADPWREAFLTVSDWASALTSEAGISVAASREGDEIRLEFPRNGTEDVLVLAVDSEGGDPVLRATRRELDGKRKQPPVREG